MEIEVRDNPSRHRFELTADGRIGGILTYRLLDGGRTVDLLHTEIDGDLGQHGLGSTLVRGALDELRRRGALVRPSCTFVAGYIDRHGDYADLVAPDPGGVNPRPRPGRA